jgi:hypothetical protein
VAYDKGRELDTEVMLKVGVLHVLGAPADARPQDIFNAIKLQ